MKFMTANEIRQTWLRFFENKKHHIIKSAPLVPKDDPTLLWINAGVAPLKKYFDGTLIPVSKRLTNVQKCIRTNDIDNVGLTSRHHTFFEMLGNFSIGDYFKNEAIEFAYELLTSSEYFAMPLEKLYITYYTNDIDCRNKWLSLGIDPSHLIAMEDNYWEIGEGPSGPNTEIFYDRGDFYDKRGIELIALDLENDRYIEIWNVVFSQYNAQANLTRSEYPELPSKNIDTGAGLERFASIIQNTKTNFETDLFWPIIEKLEKIANISYSSDPAFKVIADHIKTLVFAISDGAVLSNEGRGYVLRRLLRRAVKFGRNLNIKEPFLYKLVDSVIVTMSDFYPEIKDSKIIVEKIIYNEEEQFIKTISEGEKHFFESVNENKNLSGEVAFKLYDTYGFPIELTLEYALENGVTVDVKGFEEELLKQKERSRQSREQIESMKSQDEAYLNFKDKSVFSGYENYEIETTVIKVFKEGIVLKETPFYATSGGQVADIGTINNNLVTDVIKLPNKQHLHVVEGSFKVGDLVVAKIDQNYRKSIIKNHTATHLLHRALKDVLGNHVNQQGSLVNSKILRFDFNHYENITDQNLLEIEKIVNDKIQLGLDVDISEMTMDEAEKLNAMALFNEKYDDLVRVVNMGYSVELCGGCHVTNTKDIKKFSIISLESIGSGTYRIVAATANNILNQMELNDKHLILELNDINLKLKELNDNKDFILNFDHLSYNDLIANRKTLKNARNYLHEVIKTKAENETKDVLKNADSYIKDKSLNKQIIRVYNISQNVLKQLADIIFDKIQGETLVLVNVSNDEFTAVIKTNGKTHAGNLIKSLMQDTNGRGGGRENLAQGGSKDIKNLDNALLKLKENL